MAHRYDGHHQERLDIADIRMHRMTEGETEPCGSCGGTGSGSLGGHDTICYECKGHGEIEVETDEEDDDDGDL